MTLTVEIDLASDFDDEESSAELQSLTRALKASYIPRSSIVERSAAAEPEDMGVGTELLVHLSDQAGVAAFAAGQI